MQTLKFVTKLFFIYYMSKKQELIGESCVLNTPEAIYAAAEAKINEGSVNAKLEQLQYYAKLKSEIAAIKKLINAEMEDFEDSHSQSTRNEMEI